MAPPHKSTKYARQHILNYVSLFLHFCRVLQKKIGHCSRKKHDSIALLKKNVLQSFFATKKVKFSFVLINSAIPNS